MIFIQRTRFASVTSVRPMSYEMINEPVEVLIAFRNDQPEPMVFKWGRRYYHRTYAFG